MKDLWADLEVDGDDGVGFSLEQLERELSHLDDRSSDNNAAKAKVAESSNILENTFAPPEGGLTMSVASRIVEHQNSALLPTSSRSSSSASKIAPPATADAWQESLKKFTSMGGLEQDFLAADSAKKVSKPPPGFMDQAEEYSLTKGPVSGTPVVATPMSPPGIALPVASQGMVPPKTSPPPGLAQPDRALPPVIVQSSTTLPPGLGLPPGMEATTVPTQSDGHSEAAGKALDEILYEQKDADATSFAKDSNAKTPATQATKNQKLTVSTTKQPPLVQKSGHPMQLESAASQKLTSTPHHIKQQQPHGLISPVSMQMPHIKPQNPLPLQHPPGVVPGMPVGIPVPQLMKPGSPWQGPPKTPVQAQPVRVYCQVHPASPPIPSATLESKYMSGRDLSYVLHSMLKPVLLRDTAVWDYEVQLLQRRTLGTVQHSQKFEQNHNTKSEEKTPEKLAESRVKKTMEWMKKENILGHVTKTDVTRPRALLATPKLSSVLSSEDQAQRASLWKARLYVDQGQVAATSLMEVWRSAQHGTIPAEVQPYLLKLFKVLGIKAQKDGIYTLDDTKNNLACILKLCKGRTFLSRIFDNALLPPNAVQTLLPVTLQHTCGSLPVSDDVMIDNRLFASICRVIVNLKSLSPETLHACLKAVSVKEALSSQARMECVHAILRMGNVEPTKEWKEAEADFMKLLG